MTAGFWVTVQPIRTPAMPIVLETPAIAMALGVSAAADGNRRFASSSTPR